MNKYGDLYMGQATVICYNCGCIVLKVLTARHDGACKGKEDTL